MFELYTFGRLDLGSTEDRSLQALLSKPKLVALLVYLALPETGHPHRRDTLLGLFWPDLDAPAARHALRQALTRLRRALGREALETRGDDGITLSDGTLWCDAAEFRGALDEGDPRRALELYRGPFLEGFYLRNVPAFERWLGRTRDEFARTAFRASVALSESAETDGDEGLAGAIHWMRSSLSIDPCNEFAWQRLIDLLDRRGDRAGALRAYRECAHTLGYELGVEPSPETRALVTRIREREEARAPTSAQEPEAIRSLAVLPLACYSADPEAPLFAEGMTEMLIATLARSKGVDVIGRTSVARFGGDSSLSVKEIGRALGVDAVIEGSVTRAGSKIRLVAQLIEVESERHRWVDIFEGRWTDLLGLQRELAEAIAASLETELTAPGALTETPKPIDAKAQEAYLRGLFLWNRWTERGFKEALAEFQSAVEREPDFALPHVGIARAYSTLGYFGALPPEDAMPRSIAAALRALELDPSLGEAYADLGMGRMLWDWEPGAAAETFERALQLAPSSATAWWGRSLLLSTERRFDEALAAIDRARRLDPLSLPIMSARGWVQLASADLAAADRTAAEMRRLDPAFPAGPWLQGETLVQRGDAAAAIAPLEEAVSLSGGAPFIVATLARALARSGRGTEARRLADELEVAAGDGYVPPVARAMAYDALGDLDAVVAALRRALDVRDGWLLFLQAWPRLENAASDPRLQSILGTIEKGRRAGPG